MEEFTVKLADIPIRIRCRYSENRSFFRDYLTEHEPLFTIEPRQEDLERMQTDFDRMDEADGFQKHQRTDVFLENNAIHALVAERLVEEGVLLMHGSALCMDGEAYIFTAPSGTGKSTHARLWREMFKDRVWMINDDKPMVKIEDGKAEVFGTPWDGKHHLSRNASAKLKAVVDLQRDEVNHIEPMKKSDAFPILMKQIYCSENPITMMRIMELEKTLLDAADFYTLGCNIHQDAAMTAWKGMNTRSGGKERRT